LQGKQLPLILVKRLNGTKQRDAFIEKSYKASWLLVGHTGVDKWELAQQETSSELSGSTLSIE
jgi:hypothetical protein